MRSNGAYGGKNISQYYLAEVETREGRTVGWELQPQSPPPSSCHSCTRGRDRKEEIPLLFSSSCPSVSYQCLLPAKVAGKQLTKETRRLISQKSAVPFLHIQGPSPKAGQCPTAIVRNLSGPALESVTPARIRGRTKKILKWWPINIQTERKTRHDPSLWTVRPSIWEIY